MSIEIWGHELAPEKQRDIKKIYISGESWKQFQQLIHRGANLWADAPADIKEFADKVTNGEVLQQYHSHSSTQLDTSNGNST